MYCPTDRISPSSNGLTLAQGIGRRLPRERAGAAKTRTPAEAKQAAERDLVSLLPALEALGLFDVFELRSPALRDEVARHRAALSPSPAVAAASPPA
jgi:hypothetical protein